MEPVIEDGRDLTDLVYSPTEKIMEVPSNFPRLEIPVSNPLTEEGAELGRHLFYDPIMSLDSTISCASCHLASGSFADPVALSVGVDGKIGDRHSMTLLNVAFISESQGLFWDGRAKTLEEQALDPIINPVEMNNTWEEVERRLRAHNRYPEMFRAAFGIENSLDITRDHVTKALAQFERTMISSGMSKYDQVQYGLDVYTDQELMGHDLFFDVNALLPDAECSHCHNIPLGTVNGYFNNGLDEASDLMDFADLGKGKVTGLISDNGTFRAPTLRNIKFSAPYMHDGRHKTLREVLNHYNSGGKNAPNKDPLIRPLGLNEEQLDALEAFVLTMTEPDFMERQELQSPFK